MWRCPIGGRISFVSADGFLMFTCTHPPVLLDITALSKVVNCIISPQPTAVANRTE
jgi:hypothetical protein